MKNLFLPYELSLLAKRKGFPMLCIALVDIDNQLHLINDIDDESELNFKNQADKWNGRLCVKAPMHQQITDWLRDSHKILAGVQLQGNTFKQIYIPFTVKNLNPNNTEYYVDCNDYNEALDIAIEEALKLI